MIDLENGFNEIATNIHSNNARWWCDIETGERIERVPEELLMLIVSEIAEAMEGERKDLMDDKLPHRKMAEVELADVLIRIFDFAGGFKYDLDINKALDLRALDITDNKGEMLFALVRRVYLVWLAIQIGEGQTTVGTRLVHLIIGVLQYAEAHNYDMLDAMEEKLAYNKIREDHQIENRKLAGGKKW